MIEVTRLNGEVFHLNPHQIEFIEATPDTHISLMSGRKFVVKEPVDELEKRIVEYRRRLASMGHEL